MPQKENTRKIPRDDGEQQDGPGNKKQAEQRKKRHEDILRDLKDVIGEAEKHREKGRKGGQ